MIQSIFLLSDSGEILIEKQFTGKGGDRAICHWFFAQRDAVNPPENLPPVLIAPQCYVLHICRNGITLLATTRSEIQPLLVLEFLDRTADILEIYLGGNLDEDVVKDHFACVYEVMYELMDGGLPLHTDPAQLKDLIPPPSLMNRVVSAITGGAVPSLPAVTSSSFGRQPASTLPPLPGQIANPKYVANEMTFSVVEELGVQVDRFGRVGRCEIFGTLHITSRLSGRPLVTLDIGDPSRLIDVGFHPCVQQRAWDSDRCLVFKPPDGSFQLLSYSMADVKKPPIYVNPQISYSGGLGQVHILVGTKSELGKGVEGITVRFPMPPGTCSSNFSANLGDVLYNQSTKVYTWEIGSIPADRAPCLRGSIQLQVGMDRPVGCPTLLVGFKMPGVALSGFKVAGLSLQNESYRVLRISKALTRASRFEIRT